MNARVLIPVKDGFLACFKGFFFFIKKIRIQKKKLILNESQTIELAFCIDLGGKRMQPDFVIEWTGSPNTFGT